MHILRRLLNRTRRHQQRLDHSFGLHVSDASLLHVNSRRLLPHRMPLPQLRHLLDRVHARVLRQRVRHHFQRLCERPRDDSIRALQKPSPFLEFHEDLRLRSAASDQKEGFLDETAHDAERVVEGAIGFVENEVVGPAEQHADRVGGGNAGDLRDAAAVELDFLDEVGVAEFVGREGIDVGDGTAMERLGDEKRREKEEIRGR